MVDVDEDLGRHIAAGAVGQHEVPVADEALRPRRDRALDLAAHEIRRLPVDHRTEGRRRLEGISDDVLPRAGDEGLDEFVVDRVGDVDPLDPAAALARVVERPVDEVLGGEGDVRVLEHEGRILAAELEAGGDEVVRGERAVDLVAPAD